MKASTLYMDSWLLFSFSLLLDFFHGAAAMWTSLISLLLGFFFLAVARWMDSRSKKQVN